MNIPNIINNYRKVLRVSKHITGFYLIFTAPFAGADDVQNGLRFSPMIVNYSEVDKKSGESITIINNTKDIFLLKGSIRAMDTDTGRDSKADSPLPDIVILPPLARLEAEGQYIFRIRAVGDSLPKDRESACIVSVTAIPAIDASLPQVASEGTDISPGKTLPMNNGGGVSLQVALRMNIRLFYRPGGVPERDNSDVSKQLRFYGSGKTLFIDNPTPYFLNLHDVSINGKKVRQDIIEGYVRPKETRSFSLDMPVEGVVAWIFGGEKSERRATITTH